MSKINRLGILEWMGMKIRCTITHTEPERRAAPAVPLHARQSLSVAFNEMIALATPGYIIKDRYGPLFYTAALIYEDNVIWYETKPKFSIIDDAIERAAEVQKLGFRQGN